MHYMTVTLALTPTLRPDPQPDRGLWGIPGTAPDLGAGRKKRVATTLNCAKIGLSEPI